MKDCIIYCAGIQGAAIYEKISRKYNVVAYSDSNEKLWGTTCRGLTVLPPADIVTLTQNGAVVFVCNIYHSTEIAYSLLRQGCENIYCIPSGLLYEYADEAMLPVLGFSSKGYYRKESPDEFSILYVQDRHCQRTNKFASVVKKNENVKVFAAYTIAPPTQEWKVYDGEFEFWSLEELFDFVKNSDFDVIHSSNEPDCFTTLLSKTGKPVIHDTHDMTSLNSIDTDGLVHEFMANTFSNGVIHVTDGLSAVAHAKYKAPANRTLVIENYLLEEYLINEALPKLSAKDGEIHCVYEGTVVPGDTGYYNFEKYWLKVAENGIHIHFYSATDNAVCQALDRKSEYLHYEGSLPLNKLIFEMTQYDCGLCIFNDESSGSVPLNNASANKFCEYLAAGLPIAIYGVPRYRKFAEEYNVARYIKFDGDINSQFKEIRSLKVPKDFLVENNMIFDSYKEKILEFYQRTACEYKKD